MLKIYMMPPKADDCLGPLGMPTLEWDVMAYEDDTFLGVIESVEDGFHFTDTFGQITEFVGGEELQEVAKISIKGELWRALHGEPSIGAQGIFELFNENRTVN